MDDGASYEQSGTPPLCERGCGFFGSPATRNLCSKCYRDYLKEEAASSANSSVGASINCCPDPHVLNPSANPVACLNGDSALETAAEKGNNVPSNKKNRCMSCNKKAGVLGYECRCGGTFCSVHRYPEKHGCKFDYRTVGRVAISNQNPLVKADKMESRI